MIILKCFLNYLNCSEKMWSWEIYLWWLNDDSGGKKKATLKEPRVYLEENKYGQPKYHAWSLGARDAPHPGWHIVRAWECSTAGAHRVNCRPRGPCILRPPTFRHWMEAMVWFRWGDVSAPHTTFPLARPPAPPGADPALRSHVIFTTIHEARRGLQSRTLRSLRTSSQNLEMLGYRHEDNYRGSEGPRRRPA